MAKVLVADDESSIRKLIMFTLEDAGHEVYEASDGEDAIAKAESIAPDLLVLDVMMPKHDGWEVLRELRRRGIRRHIRVIMLTAKSAERDFVTGWKLGIDDYMTKPFEPDELALMVNETLMMSSEQIQERRKSELEKANLLSRIESAFGEG